MRDVGFDCKGKRLWWRCLVKVNWVGVSQILGSLIYAVVSKIIQELVGGLYRLNWYMTWVKLKKFFS